MSQGSLDISAVPATDATSYVQGPAKGRTRNALALGPRTVRLSRPAVRLKCAFLRPRSETICSPPHKGVARGNRKRHACQASPTAAAGVAAGVRRFSAFERSFARLSVVYQCFAARFNVLSNATRDTDRNSTSSKETGCRLIQPDAPSFTRRAKALGRNATYRLTRRQFVCPARLQGHEEKEPERGDCGQRTGRHRLRRMVRAFASPGPRCDERDELSRRRARTQSPAGHDDRPGVFSLCCTLRGRAT